MFHDELSNTVFKVGPNGCWAADYFNHKWSAGHQTVVVATSVWFPVKAHLKILANEEKLHAQAQLKVYDGIKVLEHERTLNCMLIYFGATQILITMKLHMLTKSIIIGKMSSWKNGHVGSWWLYTAAYNTSGSDTGMKSSGAHAQVLVLIETDRANTDQNWIEIKLITFLEVAHYALVVPPFFFSDGIMKS